jgi:hypothetical protein
MPQQFFGCDHDVTARRQSGLQRTRRRRRLPSRSSSQEPYRGHRRADCYGEGDRAYASETCPHQHRLQQRHGNCSASHRPEHLARAQPPPGHGKLALDSSGGDTLRRHG